MVLGSLSFERSTFTMHVEVAAGMAGALFNAVGDVGEGLVRAAEAGTEAKTAAAIATAVAGVVAALVSATAAADADDEDDVGNEATAGCATMANVVGLGGRDAVGAGARAGPSDTRDDVAAPRLGTDTWGVEGLPCK
jgi:hypothetical protein